MKKKILAAAAAAAVLSVMTAAAGPAYAYFTTYVNAAGSKQIHLGDETTIREEYEGWEKKVSIDNKADSAQAVYVRARAYSGSQYELDYSGSGSKWTANGPEAGWYYFSDPVVPGGSTLDPKASGEEDPSQILSVKITGADKKELDVRSFNVVVIYETTPAVQDGTDKAGKILYEPADWKRGVTSAKTGGDQ